MSLLGFNFAFGARDDGFSSALMKAGQSIRGVAGQVDDLADKVTSGNFFNALNTLQLDRIADNLSDIRGQGKQLETSLEGNFRNMAAEVRPMLAQMGLTQDEFKSATSQITSTAYNLNVGAGEVAESFRAIRRSGGQTQDVLKQMGIGMKELTLITKTTGMNAESFTALVRNLTESYGFSTDGAQGFLDSFTRLSQGLGIADVAFGSLGSVLEELDSTLSSNTQFMKMNAKEQAAYVQDQVMGVQRMTKAFMGLGKTPEEAQQAALQFFKTISGERKTMDGMTIGLGDMGELFKSLAQESGFKNVDALFSNISGDPMQALEQIIAMQGQLAEAGDTASLARFNAKLQDMMGGLAFMKDAGEGFTKRLAEINAVSEKTGNGLVKMAKAAHTANRSLDDVLGMMEDRFEANLMRLTGNTRSMFVKRQKEMYATVSDEAKKLAGNETWGPLFKQFVAARKLGAAAFFMPMQRDSKQLAKALSGLDKAVAKKGFLGRLEAIKSLGIVGLFVDLNKEFKSQNDRLKDAEKSASKYYARLEALGLSVDTLKPALLGLGTAFASLFVIVKVVSAFTSLLSVGGAVIGMFGAIAGVIKALTLAVIASPVAIGAAIIAGIALIGEGFQRLAAIPEEAWQSMAKKIDGFGDKVYEVFEQIMDFDAAGFTNDLLDMFEGWVSRTFKAIGDFFGNPQKWMPVVKAVGNFFGKIGLVALAAIVKLGEIFNTIGARVFEWVGSGFSWAFDKLYEYVGKPIVEFGDAVYETLTSPFRAIADWWRDFSIANLFRKYILAPLASVFDFMANLVFDFTNAILSPIEALVNKIGDIIKFFYKKMPSFVTSRLDKMGLGKIGREGFGADFKLKREGGENAMYDSVMKPVLEDERRRAVSVSVEQSGVERRQDETNRRLGEVVEAIKSQNNPGGLPTGGPVKIQRLAFR